MRVRNMRYDFSDVSGDGLASVPVRVHPRPRRASATPTTVVSHAVAEPVLGIGPSSAQCVAIFVVTRVS